VSPTRSVWEPAGGLQFVPEPDGPYVGSALLAEIKKGPSKSPKAIDVERPAMIPGGGAGGLLVRLQRISGVTGKDRLPSAFYFQCPPLDELSWSRSADHTEWDGLDHRRYSRFSAAGLKTVGFTTLLMDNQQWYHHTEPPEIHEQLAELEDLLVSGDAFQLRIYNRLLWNSDELNMSATLRSLQVAERGGEVDGRYVSLDFSQWQESEASSRARANSKGKEARSISITHGMTLWALSVRYFGSGVRWQEIARANGITGVRAQDDLLAWAKGRGRQNLTIPGTPSAGDALSTDAGAKPLMAAPAIIDQRWL
jgi:hypothetical protein